MRFLNLNAVVTTAYMVLALSLPIVTVSQSSTPACAVNSERVYYSLPENFELDVMLVDKDGKIDLEASTPLAFYDDQYVEGKYVKFLRYDPANLAGGVMSLTNQKLTAFGEDAVLLSVWFSFLSGPGVRRLAFNSSITDDDFLTVDFTAVPSCDSYGRGFLRLTHSGEFLTRSSTRFPRLNSSIY